MFNLKTHYSLKLLVLLSVRDGDELFTIDELAEKTDIPRSFLGKIVQTLGKKGYLRTKRGPRGGVTLRRNPADIPVTEVLEDLGELRPGLDPDKACSTIEVIDNCVMEEFISDFVKNVLDNKTIEDLSNELVDEQP